MPDPRQHADRRNFVETILRYIPGFRGYLEKEYRRESDHLARTWMADRLNMAKQALDNYARGLVDQGQLDDLPGLERLRSRIDGLMSTLRGDVRGYSGFFDYVRINEEVLDRVYEQDMAMLEQVEALLKDVQQLADKPDTSKGVLDEVGRRVDDLQSRCQQRRDLLAGLGK